MNHRPGLLVPLACLIGMGALLLQVRTPHAVPPAEVASLEVDPAPAPDVARPSTIKVSLQKRVVGTFYVAGEIPGFGPVEMLVDTGSSYTVINETILQALTDAGKATFSRNLEGRMADGSSHVIPTYWLSELRLGEHCVLQHVEAAVFANSTRPILGMEILARLAPFTFTADPPGLEFSACDVVATPVAAVAP